MIQAGRLEVYDVVADPGGDARSRGHGRSCRDRCARRCASIRSLRSQPPPPADRLGEEERRQLASPRLRERRRRAGRPQGRAAAGGHEPAVRGARRGLDALRPRGVRARDPAAAQDPAAGPVQPGRRAAARHRPLGARAGPSRRRRPSTRPRTSPPDRRTCAPTSRSTTRAAASGRARCRCSSRSSPSRPIACRRSRRWRGCASGRDASRTRSRCGRASTRCGERRRPSSCSSGELAMSVGADGARRIEAFERRARRRERPSRTTSSWACCTSRPGASRRARRARPRPALAPGLPDGALQARAGERAASTSPTRRRGSRRRAGTPTRPRGS